MFSITLAQTGDLKMEEFVTYPSVAGLFFRVILTLLFIIFITYLILRLIKRQQYFRQNQKKWAKIFDYQPLGANQGLYLMELYDSVYIIAVSDARIEILKEIDINTDKWAEIVSSLQEDDLLPRGIMKYFPFRETASREKSFNKIHFQKELSEQIHRNQRLTRDVLQRGQKDE